MWSSKIDQGPRVYIEKINIVGNTRTLDKVIRREFRLVEGDAFNRVLVDRSRTRIRGLGFFKDVDVKNAPGSQPDRTNLTVDGHRTVDRRAVSRRWAIPRPARFVGEFSYTERNLFGRGQYLRASVAALVDQQAGPVQLHRAVFPGPAAGGGLRPLQDRRPIISRPTIESDTTGAGIALRVSRLRNTARWGCATPTRSTT